MKEDRNRGKGFSFRRLSIFLVAAALYHLLWQLRIHMAEISHARDSGFAWIAQGYERISLEKYIAGFMDFLPRTGVGGVLRWGLDFFPFVILAGFFLVNAWTVIFALFFKEPSRSLIDEEAYKIRNDGVDMPAIDHLNYALLVCPTYDRDILMEDMYLGEIPTRAPAWKALDIEDRPRA